MAVRQFVSTWQLAWLIAGLFNLSSHPCDGGGFRAARRKHNDAIKSYLDANKKSIEDYRSELNQVQLAA